MLNDLKFVAGAVSRKDFVPYMSNFLIRDGFIRSYNGTVGLGSPIECHIDCMPRAVPMVKAIASCTEQVVLTLTPGKRLSIHSGKFKALVEASVDFAASPHVDPEGEFVDIDGEGLMKALATVERFIGNDASQQWTNGVLLRGHQVYATNNPTLIEYTLETEFPRELNLPSKAVDELLRIGEPCERMQIADNAITFHFAGNRWLRTQLFSNQWPDFGRILDVDSNPSPIDESIFEGLRIIKPFADKLNRVFIWKGKMSTHQKGDDEGASYDIDDSGLAGIYSIPMLELLSHGVTNADMSFYPKPCMFFGKNFRGAIVGQRM